MAKSEKLFEILGHVSNNPNLTPRDLAKLCNVSERAVYRYLNTLSKVGISIQYQDGGYKIKGNYGNILNQADPEGMNAVKLLLSAGMQTYRDSKILDYGREFMKLIDMNLPEKAKPRLSEIEIVPEEVRAIHYGGTITVGHSSKPDIINPILTSETISVNLTILIFSSLVKFDSAQRPVPDLARDWEISRDGLMWTFFIREDASFHDGHPLTAHDVAFTYNAIIEPKNMSPMAERYDLIDRIETEGDYILKMFLKHPFTPLISRLGWPIAPRHLLEGQDLRSTPFNRNPVGSGPFKMAEWREDDTIVLDANREYFRRDRPILDRLIFRTYPDRESALLAISRGEMDMAINLAASDLLFVSNRVNFRVYSASAPTYYALIFNLSDPLFRDVKVRKALDYAIDKDSIIENQLKDHGSLCTGPFEVGSWAYNIQVKPTPYNAERARELLEQAGWCDNNGDGVLEKDGKPFEISLAVLNISDVSGRVALAIKAQLIKAGIMVNLIRIDGSELHEKSFQAVMTTSVAGADPDNACRSWHSKSGNANLASYNNRFVDSLIELGRQTADLEKRKAIYHKIHEMIHDDCPAIFLASGFEYIGSNYRFRNDGFSSIMHFLTTMKDWQIVDREKGGIAYEHQEEVRVAATASN